MASKETRGYSFEEKKKGIGYFIGELWLRLV